MSVLDTLLPTKRYFDVNSKKDIEIFRGFLTNNAWGGACCPFELEEPFLSIPEMIKDKMVRKQLKV